MNNGDKTALIAAAGAAGGLVISVWLVGITWSFLPETRHAVWWEFPMLITSLVVVIGGIAGGILAGLHLADRWLK